MVAGNNAGYRQAVFRLRFHSRCCRVFPGLGGLRSLEEKKNFKCSAEFVTPPQMECCNLQYERSRGFGTAQQLSYKFATCLPAGRFRSFAISLFIFLPDENA